MNRFRLVALSAAVGLTLGAGVAFGAARALDSEGAAQDSIAEAITHLQTADRAQGFRDPLAERRRARAMAFLLLAQTELQPNQGLRPLN
jgi:hypothetical protein